MEEFATTFFEGARPHSEIEMGFTNRQIVGDVAGDEPATRDQARGEAKLFRELDVPAGDQGMMEAIELDGPNSPFQAHGNAETPMKLATIVEDQVMLETGSGNAKRAPERQIGVFGKISGCYGWVKTKLRLA